ncbi:transmembrane helix containing protein [Aeromonas phage vB_AspA_Bolek]|nr:transmembrane helix containing protein [Aeromonas phage vB_AspA_Bolek]
MEALMALGVRWAPYIVIALIAFGVYCDIVSDATKAENARITSAQQVQTIADQGATITQLQADAVLVAALLLDATNKASANAKALSTTKASIKETMKNEPCRDVNLPVAAIERLRQHTNSKD